MKKKDKRVCTISHIGDNRYLLNGTPDREAIENVVSDQSYPHIIITVEGGNIRDLPGGVLPLPNGRDYLVFKKLFEVNKRPAIYLLPELARTLITAPKGSIVAQNDGVAMGDMMFCYSGESEPVGYISLQSGKTLLFLKNGSAAQPNTTQSTETAVVSVIAPAPAPEAAPLLEPALVPVREPVSVPGPDHEAASEEQPAAPLSKVMTIISAIASDERNLTLLKEIAYTAYAIISKVKNSGAASKEEIAACVVAALTDSDTRSRLRRIGSDLYHRFKELNTEVGSVVALTPGYRFTQDNEVVFDEYPDDDMLASISAQMKTEVAKAHINYDHSLGYHETFIHCEAADYGYILKDAPRMFDPTQDGYVVGYFRGQPYENMRLVNAGFRDNIFFALVIDGEMIFEVSSSHAPDIFGCFQIAGERKLVLLCRDRDSIVAELMPACTDVCTVKKQYVSYVLAALTDKVIRVIDPAPSDIKALVGKGYKIGTERKGNDWLLWAFPAGKTLAMPGLPRAIVGSAPQY